MVDHAKQHEGGEGGGKGIDVMTRGPLTGWELGLGVGLLGITIGWGIWGFLVLAGTLVVIGMGEWDFWQGAGFVGIGALLIGIPSALLYAVWRGFLRRVSFD